MSLPATIKCPTCQNVSLIVQENSTGKGQWLYCSSCRYGGDPLMWASRVWDIPILETVRKLQGLGTPAPSVSLTDDNILAYEDSFVKTQAVTREFRRKFAANYSTFSRPAMANLNSLVGFNFRGSPTAWNDGPAKLLISCDKSDTSSAFVQRNSATQYPRERSTFQGRGWGDLVGIPFYDAPGRVSGISWAGRGLDTVGDFAFQPSPTLSQRMARRVQTPTKRTHRHESGLSFLDQATQSTEDTILAVSSEWMAFQLHSRQLSHSNLPLNVISWKSDDRRVSYHSWKSLTNKKVVVWSEWLTFPDVCQAIWSGGQISTAGPQRELRSHQTIKEYLQKRNLKDVISRIAGRSENWVDLLQKSIPNMPSREVERFSILMADDPEMMDLILFNLQGEARGLLEKYIPHHDGSRSIRYGSRTVTETNGTWLSTPKSSQPNLITDAPFKIKKLLLDRQSSEAYYQGNIAFKGQSIDFFEKATVVDKDPGQFLHRKLVDGGHGIPIVRSEGQDLVQVAVAMHAPETGEMTSKVGWSHKQMEISLPNFSISLGGCVTSHTLPSPSPDLPCRNISLPEGDLTSAECQSVVSGGAGLLTMLAGFSEIVLAPAIEQTPPCLVMDERFAVEYREVLVNYLGCVPLLPNQIKATDHMWPSLIAKPYSIRSRRLVEILNGNRSVGRIIHTNNTLLRLSHRVNSKAHHVLDRPIHVTHSIGVGCYKILHHYLCDVMRRNLDLYNHNVLDDFSRWIGGYGIAVDTLDGRDERRTASISLAQLFRGVWLSEGSRVGSLPEFREGTTFDFCEVQSQRERKDRPKSHRSMLIRKQAVVTYLTKRNLPDINLARVEELLRAVGAYEGEEAVHNVSFWKVSRDWWDHNVTSPKPTLLA